MNTTYSSFFFLMFDSIFTLVKHFFHFNLNFAFTT